MDNSESRIELNNLPLTDTETFKALNKTENHKEDKYVELAKDENCNSERQFKSSSEYTISHYMGNTRQYFFKGNSPRIVIGPHCKN